MPELSDTLTRARNAHRAGQHRQAELLYQQLLQADGGNANHWHSHAVACREQGKLAEAVASFQHALQLNAQSADSYLGLAQVLIEQGNRFRGDTGR